MFLSDISIRRPVLAVMMTAALVIFGGIALLRLPVREMPKMDFPIVSVTIIYPGASPEIVEKDVIDVLEENINTVEGIRFLQSSSGEGGGQITIQFELERNIDVASQEVRDKIAAIRSQLPATIEEPRVAKLDLDAQAIMWLALTATDRDRVEITEYADKVLKPQFEKLKGVGQIIIGGAQEYAVRIWIDPDRLASRGLTVADVEWALRNQNAEIPSGRIEGFMREFTVKTEGDLTSVEAFEDIFIAYRDGAPVYLRDVGRAVAGARTYRSTARFSRLPDAVGRDTVGLGVLKQTEANTVDVAARIKAKAAEIREDLPPGMELAIAFDSAIYVEDSISEVQEALLLGGFLTVVVIFIFLVSGRSTIIAAITIPTSIIATFTVIHFLGFTINNLTMLALVLAVGVVIDDAVVVLENIFRHMEMGKTAMRAAKEGASEIAFAAIAATLSIVAVFLPLAFVTGMVGLLFKEFAITVAAAVLVSLFIALTLIPMLCSRFLKAGQEKGRLARLVDRIFDRIATTYVRQLRFALRHRLPVILAAVGLLVPTGFMFANVGAELNPEVDEGAFILIMRGPQGATLDYTDRSLREVEAILAEMPEIHTYFTAVGLSLIGIPKVNQAIAFVRLKPLDERRSAAQRSQRQVMSELRKRFAGVPGFRTLVMPRPTIASTSRAAPLQLVIMGPEIGELYEAAEEMKREVSKVQGIVDVSTNFDINKPKLSVLPDRAKAADLGVEITTIADTLRILLGGTDITQFKRGGERYDVIVQLERDARRIPDQISSLYVRARSGALVPLSALVDVKETVGPSEIRRYNRARAVTLEGNLENMPLGKALTATQAIAKRVLPSTFRTAVTGQTQDMQESFQSLGFTFVMAILVIYMLLASQFDHFVHPFTIMLALPLALFGAASGLFLMGLTLNLFSIIGIIMLMGLVTKNSILLVDYANQIYTNEDVTNKEAMMRAGRVRLRPILMTAFSTILGVLPALLGFGAGSESRQPLAATVVGGMLAATFLTLIIVPVVYTLIDDLGDYIKRMTGRVNTKGPIAEPIHAETG